jgi:sigma-B regulation protein RsbU (phosphoserine phosphatase)
MNKPQYVSEILALQQTEVRLAIALRVRDEIAGLLLLGSPEGRPQYGTGEKQLLQRAAGQFALMLENSRLTQRVVEQEKLRRDLALAAEVQKRLLPEKPPQADQAAIAAVSLPARSVGGDYYDFLDIGNRRIGIALADVAGKGVAAALIMSVVQASLRVDHEEVLIVCPVGVLHKGHEMFGARRDRVEHCPEGRKLSVPVSELLTTS